MLHNFYIVKMNPFIQDLANGVRDRLSELAKEKLIPFTI